MTKPELKNDDEPYSGDESEDDDDDDDDGGRHDEEDKEYDDDALLPAVELKIECSEDTGSSRYQGYSRKGRIQDTVDTRHSLVKVGYRVQ